MIFPVSPILGMGKHSLPELFRICGQRSLVNPRVQRSFQVKATVTQRFSLTDARNSVADSTFSIIAENQVRPRGVAKRRKFRSAL